ncbi:MAG: hypothetical protein AVO35_08470 [Candidatus Aegiribacteria sp. MLS_C]|nr:MAG: hypothetical protein AVO35_08470 [Candidatus Aegiribacteria sp. MLS_C]
MICSCSLASEWKASFDPGADSLLGIAGAVTLVDGNSAVCLAGPFEDPIVILLDEEGRTLWSTAILEKGGNSRSFESGGFLVPLDDGFAVALHSEPRATGIDTDVAVARIDMEGDTVWTFVLGLDDSDNWICTGLTACSDGGFLLTGCPGTMLPGGYVLKLGSSGDLQWMTPAGSIEGFVLSAAELPDGGFLALTDPCYGHFALLPLSPEGTLGEPVEIDAGGEPFGIRPVDDSVWILLRPEGNSVTSILYAEGHGVQDSMTAVLPEGHEVRCADMAPEGMVTAGTLDGTAFTCLHGADGTLLAEKVLDMEGSPSGLSVSADRVLVHSRENELVCSMILSEFPN